MIGYPGRGTYIIVYLLMKHVLWSRLERMMQGKSPKALNVVYTFYQKMVKRKAFKRIFLLFNASFPENIADLISIISVEIFYGLS